MTEIEILEHVLDNRKSGKGFTEGLLYNGFKSVTSNLSAVAWSDLKGYSLGPRTHIVNGFEVPAPEKASPEGKYYIPKLDGEDFYVRAEWTDHHFDVRRLGRRLIHLTAEAAIENAKAMLGIDPYAEDE